VPVPKNVTVKSAIECAKFAALHIPPVVATLTSLRIRHLALVEDLLWEPGAGFTAVTGETGAGKSIILGALKLLVGERADRSLIRTGADQCVIEAAFAVGDPDWWNPMLEEAGLDPLEEDQLVIRRLIASAGSGKQFVNGSPTTLAALRRLGEWLVDLHGPHDHQSLFSPARQLEIVDAGSGDQGRALKAYRKQENARRQLLDEMAALSGDHGQFERELDLLRHQLNEIEAARFERDDEEVLTREYRLAGNARKLGELSSEALGLLREGEVTVENQLAEVVRSLRDLARIDETAEKLHEAASQLASLSQDLAADLDGYTDDIAVEPARLAELEERVSLLETLKRKYGGSLEAVLEFAVETRRRLESLEGREERLEALRAELNPVETAWRAAANNLSDERRKSAKRLEQDVGRHLRDLGFLKAGFEIQLEPLEEPQASGAERVEFLFSANPGEPLKPLRHVASSGEVSRVMLAIKSALAGVDEVGLLVFDEIDANVGGEIAVAVGKKLRSLADSHQVLCITHLPQVAALAPAHFRVAKEVSDTRTLSTINRLEEDQRVGELARMLGGKSEAAIEHAKALLAER